MPPAPDATWQPEGGQVDGALQFDGVDDYLTGPFILDPVKQVFSAFSWIKGGQPGQHLSHSKALLAHGYLLIRQEPFLQV